MVLSTQHHVAIVEDDQSVRRATATLLEGAGYGVRAFESGDAFLAAQVSGPSDCVLLDMRMPGTDGLGVLQKMSGWETMPAVLVLTGHGAVALAVDAMKLGAVDFLEKPYPAQDLLGAVALALAAGPRLKGGTPDAAAAAKVASLSNRQRQVLKGILQGRPNKIIAYELGLSIRTVEAYRSQLFERLGVRGTAEAVRLAIAAGMLVAD
jgi:two-component system, LuxR family, response regulator FixJ